jgi:hypothetical protein
MKDAARGERRLFGWRLFGAVNLPQHVRQYLPGNLLEQAGAFRAGEDDTVLQFLLVNLQQDMKYLLIDFLLLDAPGHAFQNIVV